MPILYYMEDVDKKRKKFSKSQKNFFWHQLSILNYEHVISIYNLVILFCAILHDESSAICLITCYSGRIIVIYVSSYFTFRRVCEKVQKKGPLKANHFWCWSLNSSVMISKLYNSRLNQKYVHSYIDQKEFQISPTESFNQWIHF